jgi:hypothetical protein
MHVDPARSRLLVFVVDELAAHGAAPHNAIRRVDYCHVFAASTGHRFVTVAVSADDDIRIRPSVEPVQASELIDVVLAGGDGQGVRPVRAGDRIALVAAAQVLDLVERVLILRQAGRRRSRIEPHGYARLAL